MFLDFVRSFIGTVDSGFDFILVITAAVLLLIVCGLIISLFLGFFSSLTYKLFTS